jgi:hypothetical protein
LPDAGEAIYCEKKNRPAIEAKENAENVIAGYEGPGEMENRTDEVIASIPKKTPAMRVISISSLEEIKTDLDSNPLSRGVAGGVGTAEVEREVFRIGRCRFEPPMGSGNTKIDKASARYPGKRSFGLPADVTPVTSASIENSITVQVFLRAKINPDMSRKEFPDDLEATQPGKSEDTANNRNRLVCIPPSWREV